jgi:hypothetical protein
MQSSSTGRGEGRNGGRDQGVHGIRMEMEGKGQGMGYHRAWVSGGPSKKKR